MTCSPSYETLMAASRQELRLPTRKPLLASTLPPLSPLLFSRKKQSSDGTLKKSLKKSPRLSFAFRNGLLFLVYSLLTVP